MLLLSISSFCYFYLYLGAVVFVSPAPFFSYIPSFCLSFVFFSWHGAWEKMDATVKERKLTRE